MTDLEIKIKKSLDEYLEFNSNELFKNSDYITIFGGAIRDIIADQPINDIDILTLPVSMVTAMAVLEKHGYKQIELYSLETFRLYTEISVIQIPITYINSNFKKVQFIRPRIGKILPYNNSYNEYSLITCFFNLLENVDLSCCGTFWDGENLYEAISGSVRHCMQKKFLVLDENSMYNRKRIEIRKYKMIDRDWDEIVNQNNLSKQRLKKIDDIFTENLQLNDYKIKKNFIQKFDIIKNNNYDEDLPF
jgi:hypothetical protein